MRITHLRDVSYCYFGEIADNGKIDHSAINVQCNSNNPYTLKLPAVTNGTSNRLVSLCQF